MIYIGVDPDTHALPIATIHGDRKVQPFPAAIQIPQGWLQLEVLRVRAHAKGDEAAVAMAKTLFASQQPRHASAGKVLCVEMQNLLPGMKARPADVARLSFLSGAAVASIAAEHVYTPLPQQWKGNVTKHIHQARIAAELGWEIAEISFSYCVPLDPEISKLVPKPGDWKHAFDAIGLALWAKKQHELKEQIRAARA